MRLTAQLNSQHLGWYFKQHWRVQGKRTPRDTGAKDVLLSKGIQIEDALNYIKPKFERIRLNVVGFREPEILENESHPKWKDTPCYIYGDRNVLLEGIDQAKILTKTIEINHLPEYMESDLKKITIHDRNIKNIENAIYSSHLFDTEQEKTKKLARPDKANHFLPRIYGITDLRKTRLILSKLLFECEKICGASISNERKIMNDANFVASFEKDNDRIQFDVTANTFMTSKRPIRSVKCTIDAELPNLFPTKYTISLLKKNIYDFHNFYPVPQQIARFSPQTLFFDYSPDYVQNLHEEPVTQTQFESRTMLKAFAAATTRAMQLYGENIKKIPEPIVIQSVQTDGKSFHFGVYQLNTLDLDGVEGLKNYWFHLKPIDLFEECLYKFGRPTLSGYNPEILKHMLLFYKN